MNSSRDRLLLFFILALVVFYPLAFVGFATNDDAVLSLVIQRPDGLLSAAYNQAAGLGRFMVMLSFPITQIPYLLDNQIWAFGVKIFGFALLLGAIYWAVLRVFKSSAFALLSLVLILIILQNGWNHDLFTSYPLVFNFYATCFFASVALFVAALEEDRVMKAWLAAVFYFFSMGTEVFVAYAFLFPLLLLSNSGKESKGVVDKLRARFRILLPIMAGLVAYLLIYVAWRQYYAMAHSYDGNSFNGTSTRGFFKVIYTFGINGFPVLPFENLTSTFSEVYRQSPFLMLSTFIKAIVAAALVIDFVKKPMLTGLSAVYLIGSLGVSAVCVFLVNLFLALTVKYQTWVDIGARSFTYTFYSMIFAAIASALVLAMVSRASIMQKPAGRRVVLTFIGGLVVVVAGTVGINNQAFFQDQALSNQKWRLFDMVMKSEDFRAIPEGAVIYSPSLSAHQRGIAQALAPYWSHYVKAKIDKSVKFQTGGCELGKACYFLSFTQDLYRDEQYMVLARVETSARVVAKEFIFFGLPNMGGRVVNGFFAATVMDTPTLSLNKKTVEGGVSERMFSVQLPKEKGRATRISVASNTPIFLDRLTVALASQPVPVSSVVIRFGEGFSQLEMSGSESWTWAGAGTSLQAENFRAETLSVVVSGEANSIHHKDRLEFSLAGHSLRGVDIGNDGWTKFAIQLELPQGISQVELKGRKEAIRPSTTDPRLLSFRIRNLKVELTKTGDQQ